MDQMQDSRCVGFRSALALETEARLLQNSVFVSVLQTNHLPQPTIDLFATDKSRYFAQPRPIIVSYGMSIKLLIYYFLIIRIVTVTIICKCSTLLMVLKSGSKALLFVTYWRKETVICSDFKLSSSGNTKPRITFFVRTSL